MYVNIELMFVCYRTKGVFTHSDPVTDPVTVKYFNCVNGDGLSDGRIGVEPILPVRRPVTIGTMMNL